MIDNTKALPLRDVGDALEASATALRDLDGATILVTGATGFVGSWLTGVFWSARITGVTTAKVLTHSRSLYATNFGGDIRRLQVPERVTHIVHCASAASGGENAQFPEDVVSMIADGSHRVANEAKRVGAKLLHLSSGSVYHPRLSNAGAYTEQTPRQWLDDEWRSGVEDRNIFAQAKVQAEWHAEMAGATIARLFALCGPRMPKHFAVAEWVREGAAGRPIRLNAARSGARSYLYAPDAVSWLLELLAHGERGRAYNGGGSRLHDLFGWAGMVAEAAGVELIVGDGDGPPPFSCAPGSFPLPMEHQPEDYFRRWIAWERGV